MASFSKNVAVLQSYVITVQLIITNIFFVIILNYLINRIAVVSSKLEASSIYDTVCQSDGEIEPGEKAEGLEEDL